jgi:ribosomal-protein-alanine N-acetyltransferase
MEARDLELVLAIQAASPQIAQWSAADYNLVDRAGTSGWVAESDGRVVGFLIARYVLEEIEILNLAVHPDFRRCGAGSLLLSEALDRFSRKAATKVFLEVRESNVAATSFYSRHNFTVAGRRPRYYAAPPEDALMLALEIGER